MVRAVRQGGRAATGTWLPKESCCSWVALLKEIRAASAHCWMVKLRFLRDGSLEKTLVSIVCLGKGEGREMSKLRSWLYL